MENIAEGQLLEVNAFANYDTLAKLIDKYNSEVGRRTPKLAVDPGIGRIRDALAHGRIAGLSPSLSEPLRLIKYDRPVSGRVHVTDYCVLTKEWFEEKIRLVYESIKRVSAADGLFRSQD